MFTASQKLELLCKIAATIDIPAPEESYKKHGFCIQFKYAANARQWCTVLSKDDEKSLAILKRINKISRYTRTASGFQMFTQSLITISGPKGQPVQHLLEVTRDWEDLEFSPAECRTIASMAELERIEEIMHQGPKAKVISMFSKNILRAA